jgi:hypothetical protein
MVDVEFVAYNDVEETVWHTPETHLGYNTDGDLVKMKKYTIKGGIFIRVIEDPDVTDKVVTRWVKYRKWQEKSQ